MFRLNRLVFVLGPALIIAAVVSILFGGAMELQAAHGLLHVAAGQLTPDVSNPVPFWG